MARPLTELQQLLKGLDGVEEAYIQPPTTGMVYPCIMIERDTSNRVSFADNLKYYLKKSYSAIVVDRNPHSLIPDLVEGLPHSRYERYYVANGLNHFVFQIYF